MAPRFQELFLAIPKALGGRPDNLASALKRLPAVGRLPTPSETRALPALLEYRERKLWAVDLLASDGILNEDNHGIVYGGISFDPELSFQNTKDSVIALPADKTEYFFVRRCCAEPCMSWKYFIRSVAVRTQEPECSAAILPFAEVEPSLSYVPLVDYPSSIREELRRRDKLDLGTNYLTFCDLRDAGIIVPARIPIFLDDSGDLVCSIHSFHEDVPFRIYEDFEDRAFTISGELLEHGAAIGLIYEGTAEPCDRLWRLACVGDWIGAHSAALELGDQALAKLTQERAAQCRKKRLGRIHAEIRRDGGLAPRTLMALDDLGAEYSAPHLTQALSLKHRAVRTAMGIVTRRDDPSWLDVVWALRLSLGTVGESDENSGLAKACESFIEKGPTRPPRAAGVSPQWGKAGRAIELN